MDHVPSFGRSLESVSSISHVRQLRSLKFYQRPRGTLFITYAGTLTEEKTSNTPSKRHNPYNKD